MKLLLDTHAFIFFVNGDEQLSQSAKSAILDNDNIKFLSIASVWEIAIKVSLGKLELKQPISFLSDLIEQNGFVLQDVEIADAILVSSLPYHHRDPFDRMIMAQAELENFPVITYDQAFQTGLIQVIPKLS